MAGGRRARRGTSIIGISRRLIKGPKGQKVPASLCEQREAGTFWSFCGLGVGQTQEAPELDGV
jgi:hypothetical protein